MKKQLKTYAIHGMMEYVMTIMIGGVIPRTIHFSRGSSTVYGQKPATYTTSDIVEQLTIESLPQYKDKMIILYKTVPLEEEVCIHSEEKGCEKCEEKEEVKADTAEVSVENKEPIRVAFNTVQEAKEYLVENHGATASHVSKRDDIVAWGAANGIDIIFE